MKKRLVIILIVLFSAAFLIFTGYQYKEISITEAAELNNKNVTKIVLTDGRDISKSTTIESKQKIEEFMKLADNEIIKKEKKRQYSNGWQNSVDFYSNDKKLETITFAIDVEIDGKYYEIIKGDLTQKKIIELINSETSKN